VSVRYLTLDELLVLCERYGYGPVADSGLLAAAAARPVTSVAGQDAYETLQEKAAALLESICGNHALVDGNKRLALHAAAVFLRLNGSDIDLDDDARFQLTYDVADGSLRGVSAIAGRMPLRDRG
jgi:death-on-curing protein